MGARFGVFFGILLGVPMTLAALFGLIWLVLQALKGLFWVLFVWTPNLPPNLLIAGIPTMGVLLVGFTATVIATSPAPEVKEES